MRHGTQKAGLRVYDWWQKEYDKLEASWRIRYFFPLAFLITGMLLAGISIMSMWFYPQQMFMHLTYSVFSVILGLASFVVNELFHLYLYNKGARLYIHRQMQQLVQDMEDNED